MRFVCKEGQGLQGSHSAASVHVLAHVGRHLKAETLKLVKDACIETLLRWECAFVSLEKWY